MKKSDAKIPKTEEGFELRLRSRATATISIQIPVETLASLEKVGADRDMSADALIKLYVGQGLRQDLAKLFADRVLEKTAQILTRHIQSKDEVSAILKEIRIETTG
jgi:hypothetical protein